MSDIFSSNSEITDNILLPRSLEEEALNLPFCQYNQNTLTERNSKFNLIRKYLSVLNSNCDQAIDIVKSFNKIFDINNLEGGSLDILGSLVGFDRDQCAVACAPAFTMCETLDDAINPDGPYPADADFEVEAIELSSIIPETFGPWVDPQGDPVTLIQTGLPSSLSFTDNTDGTFTISGTMPSRGNYFFTVCGSDPSGNENCVQYLVDSTRDPLVCGGFITPAINTIQDVGNINRGTVLARLLIGNNVKLNGTGFVGFKTYTNLPNYSVAPPDVQSQSNAYIKEYYSEFEDAVRWRVTQIDSTPPSLTVNTGAYSLGTWVSTNITAYNFINSDEVPPDSDISRSVNIKVEFECSAGSIVEQDVTLFVFMIDTGEPPSGGGSGGPGGSSSLGTSTGAGSSSLV